MPAVQLVAFLLVPLPLLGLAARRQLPAWLSPVILCYAVGIIAGNLGLPLRADVTEKVATAAVLLAIPLLVASADFLRWLRLARRTALACLLCFSCVIAVACLTAPLFMSAVADGWIVAGMLVGTYTGSAPNMAAVAQALGAPPETLILLTTTDLILGGALCFLLLSPAVRLLSPFLPAFPKPPDAGAADAAPPPPAPMRLAPAIAASLALGLIAVAVAGGLSLLVPESAQQLVAILAVTALGIGGSLVPRIRALPCNYLLGDYFILVFCVAFGSLANFSQLLASTSSGPLFAWTACVLLGSVAAHVLACRLFGVDRDTALITLTAAIYGPAFVPPVASNLRNPELVLSGVTAALFGLAVGNYLGVAVAWVVRSAI